MNESLRKLAREPLVHFVIVGALLALLESIATPSEEIEAPRTVIVDAETRRGLALEWEHDQGRAPNEAELDEAVERWIDEEVLFREGMLRELDRDDLRVRQRVATLTLSLLEAEHPLAEPDDDALRAYFDSHLERYAEAARFDFVQVYVEGTDEVARGRADALLAQLEAGASPIGLGDTYSGGRHFRGRTLDDLASSFGPSFATDFADAPDGRWTLRSSRTGLHLVRIDSRAAASAADFERARVDVEHDLLESLRLERTQRVVRELRDRWRVIER